MMRPLFLAAIMALSTHGVLAGTYPDKQIELIAGTAPGGTVDKLARVLARHLQERLKMPAVVENRQREQ
jgi:tripartite-type tricarboxylate transporter receptor subunit TctC